MADRSEQPGLFESGEGTVLVHRLEGTAAKLHADVGAEFGNPDALGLEVGRNRTLHDLGDVAADTALFLGQAGTMDSSAGADLGSSNDANTGHGKKSVWGCGARRMAFEIKASRRNPAVF